MIVPTHFGAGTVSLNKICTSYMSLISILVKGFDSNHVFHVTESITNL